MTGARGFLKRARQFAKDSRFDTFFKKHEKLYATAVQRMKKVLDQDARLQWFDEFFGARRQAHFELALGMLNGPCNYAARLYRKDGTEDLHCVLGVWETDGEGLPKFDKTMLPTVVHEFCHSYCNPLVDKHKAELRAAALKIFPHVAETMKKQAYGNWKTMMYESLVRACVVRYRLKNESRTAARMEIGVQHRRGFRWTGELSKLLGKYEEDRKKYKTLDAFMPEVAKFFNDYAPRFEAEIAKAPKAPKVIEMTPANGARNVDPGLTELKVTFSQPMKDRCWAFVGRGPKYPETTGKPSYDKKRTTITLPVKLKENWSYELWLNRGRFSSFQSEEGVKLTPVRVRFRTGARRK